MTGIIQKAIAEDAAKLCDRDLPELAAAFRDDANAVAGRTHFREKTFLVAAFEQTAHIYRDIGGAAYSICGRGKAFSVANMAWFLPPNDARWKRCAACKAKQYR